MSFLTQRFILRDFDRKVADYPRGKCSINLTRYIGVWNDIIYGWPLPKRQLQRVEYYQAYNLKHGRCAKFNIGFGFLLEHKLTHEFRYYYVSTNTMLFKTAHTISKRKDIKDIIEIIHDMNVGEHYYLMRPNSSWTVAGVTNMKFKLFYLGPVLE